MAARPLLFPFLMILAVVSNGCVTTPQLSPEQRRALETKEFDGSYEVTFKASVTVLQDRGYIIKSSDYDGGIIQAETGSQFVLFVGSTQNLLSLTLEPLSPERTLARMNVLTETTVDAGQYGSSKNSHLLGNAEFYRGMFQAIQAEIYRRQTLRKGRGFEKPVSSQPIYVAPSAPSEDGEDAPAAEKEGGAAGSAVQKVAKNVAHVPATTVSAAVSAPVETIQAMISQDRSQNLNDEMKKLQAEEKLLEKQLELIQKKKALEEQKQELKSVESRAQTAEKEEEIRRLQKKSEEGLNRFEKYNFQSVGLSKDVDNLLVGSKVDGLTDVFHLTDKKIVWFCKFRSGFKGMGTSFMRPKYTATWYGPSGNVYHQESFTYSFGNASLFRTSIELDPSKGQQLLGSWRVEVRHKKDLIDERDFTVVE